MIAADTIIVLIMWAVIIAWAYWALNDKDLNS